MPGEKAWWEQYKNAVCVFAQILEVVPKKTTVVRPFTFYLIKSTKQRRQDMLGTAGEVMFSYGLLCMNTTVLANQ